MAFAACCAGAARIRQRFNPNSSSIGRAWFVAVRQKAMTVRAMRAAPSTVTLQSRDIKMTIVEFAGSAIPLSDPEIQVAADRLRCPRAVIDAVCDVESSGGGFLPDRRPKILFEAHVFGRLTGQRCGPALIRGSARRHGSARFTALPAHTSTSGCKKPFNSTGSPPCKARPGAGFRSSGSITGWSAMTISKRSSRPYAESEANHLEVFLRFCEARGLADALRTRDWETFARIYNGPGEVTHYAAALRAAFARHSAASGRPRTAGAAPFGAGPGGTPVAGATLAGGPAAQARRHFRPGHARGRAPVSGRPRPRARRGGRRQNLGRPGARLTGLPLPCQGQGSAFSAGRRGAGWRQPGFQGPADERHLGGHDGQELDVGLRRHGRPSARPSGRRFRHP